MRSFVCGFGLGLGVIAACLLFSLAMDAIQEGEAKS